jgi:hypothetical protein
MSEEETKITFRDVSVPPKEILRIVPTETGWDICIPEDVTLTEAAQRFVNAVNEILGRA